MNKDKIEFSEVTSGIYRILESNIIGYPKGKYVKVDDIIVLANAEDVEVEICDATYNWVTL